MRHILLRPRTLVVVLVVALVATGGLVAWAYVFGLPSGAGAEGEIATGTQPPITRPSTSTSTTQAPAPTTTTTTLPPMPDVPVVRMPDVPESGLSYGGDPAAVMLYEMRLKMLHFDPGEVDGVFDGATQHAVEAVQKLYGLPRTGVITRQVGLALSAFQWPEPMVADAEPTRAEVDLDRQVMVVWTKGQITLITTVSTGSGRVFCGGNDGCQYATTPTGRYEFQWRVNGWRDGSLGRMYKPFYFNGGIAVHGYQSVPTEPASHGCVRIPMHIAEYFQDLVTRGEAIYVIGTQAAPYGPAPGRGGSTPAPTTTTTPPTTAKPAPSTTTPPTTAEPPASSTTTTTKPPTSSTTTAAPTTTTAAP